MFPAPAAHEMRIERWVTFNHRHFDDAAGRFGIAVLSPPQALRRMSQQ